MSLDESYQLGERQKLSKENHTANGVEVSSRRCISSRYIYEDRRNVVEAPEIRRGRSSSQKKKSSCFSSVK